MKYRYTLAAASAALLLAAPASAESALVGFEPGTDWKHAETGIVIPAKVATFRRGEGFDYGKSASDIAFQYYDDATGTHVTLYYFRAGLPDVSIWADRVEATVLVLSDDYGTFDRAGRRWTTFTPSTGGENSAIRFAYPLSGRGKTATAAAFEQRGAWLVGARITSTRLGAAELDAALANFMTALNLAPSGEAPQPAYAMAPCADRLPSERARKAADQDTAAAMLGGLLEGVVSTAPSPASDGRYCREADNSKGRATYRLAGSRERYIIAFGDSGVVLKAGRPVPLEPKDAPGVGLLLVTNDMMIGFGAFDALPSPDQALEAVDNPPKPAFGRSRLPGKEKEIIMFGGK